MDGTLLWRQDTLSGLGNIFAFFDRLAHHTATPLPQSLSIVYFDLANLAELNRREGQETGNRALRWLALALQDEVASEACFRLRDDEFVGLLQGASPAEAQATAQRVQDRFLRFTADHQQRQTGTLTLLHVIVLHVDAAQQVEPVDLVIMLEAAMQQLKASGLKSLLVHYPVHLAADLRETVHTLISRVLQLGQMLDRATSEAETDPLTQMANSRAMDRILVQASTHAATHSAPFALLLVDGDNLRAFNKISYAAGDEMIRQLAALLARGLREQDRIARWRVGDEFLIVLPGAGEKEALLVAERLVQTVQQSRWQLPVTISVGIALYPDHGTTVAGLVLAVEQALQTAKEQGKNKARLAERLPPLTLVGTS